MDSINNYINQINRSGGVSSFSSVEDLIRSHLGNSFVDQKKEITNQEIHQDPEDQDEVNDIINSSIQRLKNFDPSINKPHITREEIKEPDFIKDTKKEEYKEKPGFDIPNKSRNYYPFYRDAEEIFEFKVTIEGSSSQNTLVRLLLESDSWNLVFQGKLKKDGTCSIPIRKLSIFPPETIGKATLEVIIDDVLFTPWENPFRIEESRKVGIGGLRRRPK